MEQKCIFCAIVANQIPSIKVYEDDNFIAFLDIRPLNKGHTLIIPKKHYRWVYDVEDFGHYWEIAKKIALAALDSLEAKTVQFITMGFEVPHAHIHLIPRYDDDGHAELPDRANVKQMSEQELKETAEKIKNAIPAEKPKVEEKMEQPLKKEKKWSKEELELIRRELQQT